MKKAKILFGVFATVAMLASCGGEKTKPKSNDENKKDSVTTDSVATVEGTEVDTVARKSADFAVFIKYFLTRSYYNNNFDSLVQSSSTITADFMNKEAGFARYFNVGAFCNLYKTEGDYGYPFSDEFHGESCKFSDLPLNTKKPVEGFCEESKDANGVYYYAADKFPEAWDMEKDKSVKTTLPAKFAKAAKMKVDIMFEKWIVKQFYFAQIDNVWYLVFVDDCDCSA